MKKLQGFEQLIAIRELIKWLCISFVVGIVAGTASAALLTSLEWATKERETHLFLLALLPLGGLLSGWIYHRFGRSIEGGNNLILEEIHTPKDIIPLRMAVLVLLGTVLTHLFGGSAGREGTAIQMGASLADQLTKLLRFGNGDRRILLMAGMSGGFGSVFGIPMSGTLFGLEVLAIGFFSYDAIFPCLIASVVGNRVTLLWGVRHPLYHVPFVPDITIAGLLDAIIAGAICGIVAMFFAQLTHQIRHRFRAYISYAPIRPAIGGALIALIVWVSGTTKYIGLGVPTIVDSFLTPQHPWDFAAKVGLTALTLGAGFKGGEVTPLFFIGATLGNTMSLFLGLPMPLLAGMGLAAVFAGAANTPLASTLMAFELFGHQAGVYAGIACVVSYIFSGHTGIYSSQLIGLSKYFSRPLQEGLTLASHAKTKSRLLLDLDNDLHLRGFLQAEEETLMTNLTALRFYFDDGARVERKGVWQKLTSPDLFTDIADSARAFGIQQVVLHRVSGGFLKGDPLTYDRGEIPHHKREQCLELIDIEEKLRLFLDRHRAELKDVRVVLLRCEEVLL